MRILYRKYSIRYCCFYSFFPICSLSSFQAVSLGSLSLSLSFFRSSSLICLYHSMYAGLFFLSRSSCQILYMKKSNHISHLLTWHSITNIIFAHIYTDRARVNGCIRAKMKKKEEETWENERKKKPTELILYVCYNIFTVRYTFLLRTQLASDSNNNDIDTREYAARDILEYWPAIYIHDKIVRLHHV